MNIGCFDAVRRKEEGGQKREVDMNYYNVLGVDKNASAAAIKVKYREHGMLHCRPSVAFLFHQLRLLSLVTRQP